MSKSKTDIFIAKARAKHGDRYDYSKTVYKKSKEKLIITCKNHGDFNIRADAHPYGQGCPRCGHSKRAALKTLTKDEFVKRSKALHGKKYGYGSVEYAGTKIPVLIECKEHGLFKQTPCGHMSGKGCAKCSRNVKLTSEEFVRRAKTVHRNRYTYELSQYFNQKEKVKITCKAHGAFDQLPCNHLRGARCPVCVRGGHLSTRLYLLEYKGMIKIGVSTDVDRRHKELRFAQGFTSKLIRQWPALSHVVAYSVEKEVHSVLADYSAKLKGFDGATEWFKVHRDAGINAIDRALGEVMRAKG